jgi:N-acetylglucosamine-6-phosphate deacetylase
MTASTQAPPDTSSRLVLAADRVVTATGAELAPGWIEITCGKVAAVGAGRPARGVAEPVSGTIVPGFVDMHAHGALGHDFVSAADDSIHAIRQHHARRGTTTLMATVATAPIETMLERVRFLRPYVAAGLLAGIHLEGPYLAPERRGAHDPSLLRHPDAAEIRELLAEAAGTLRMVTLAPELPGSPEAVEMLVAAGVTVAVGHTACTAEQARAAFDAGASVLTHAFNGMPPLHHREAGPLGVALVDQRVTVELILDGHHVGYEAAELVRRVAHGRLALVSDAMSAAGLGDGNYRVAGSAVVVRNGIAMLADGSSLAGSTITVADAFARLRDAHGASWADGAAATSLTPTRAVGVAASGLREGEPADLVLVNGGAVAGVMRAGQWVVEPTRDSACWQARLHG